MRGGQMLAGREQTAPRSGRPADAFSRPSALPMNDPLPAGAAVHAKSQGIDPLIGRVINDRYKVLALVARGGMGKVYRAEQAPLGRLVALKVLNATYVGESDPEFHKRFFLEAS